MLHLRFFGTFHVTFADGRTPAIDTLKSRALLTYLATESGRPHLREQLAALFWPEADQKAAMQSLRQAIYMLRRELQPASEGGAAPRAPYLTVTRQDVAFNFDSEYWCDVEQFVTLIRAAQQHPHQSSNRCLECIADLETAVDLYQGEFLAGLTLPDADEFEAWRLARQEGFRTQMLHALSSLTGFYERRRDFGAAQRFLLRHLELAPWDEDAHHRLIRLYALDNQRNAALQQFETARRVLAEQLNAPPSSETLQLLQDIQHNAPLTSPIDLGNPYKGLYAFSSADRADFFGREETVDFLVRRLNETRTVFLIGSSGSGKSSIIRAGLIPALASIDKLAQLTQRSEARPAGWSIVEFRPGAEPLHALAEALAHLPHASGNVAAMLRRLRVEGATLNDPNILPSPTRTLIFADQFEELYTLCASASTRQKFIDLLVDAALSSGGATSITLIIAMRADFVSQALIYRPLTDALQRGGVVLGPMSRHELRRAIEEPARNRGIVFEPGLTERLLDDVGQEPGNLPLLQFALSELWARRTGYVITHDAYDAIGRVSGALASYADQVYAQLSTAEQVTARRLLIQLVQPGDETGDTRRPALRSELSDAAWTLTQKLADLRLVVTGHSDRGESVELVHEALIRGWVQLCEWMDEDRDFRRWQQRLRAYLQQWIASDRETDALLRGVVLTEAERWIDLRRTDLSHNEQMLIDESLRARDAKHAAIEMERQVELERTQALATAEAQRAEAEHRRAELERTARRRLRWFAVGLASVTAVAIVAAVFAFWQQRQADLFAGQSLARQLAAQSLNLADNATDLALLLSVEAIDRTTDPADLTNYLVAFPISGYLDRFFRGGVGDLTSIAVTPDDQHLLTVAENGSLTSVARWDVATGRQVRELLPPQERSAVALTADGAWIATAEQDVVQLWDGEDGEPGPTWSVGADQQISQLKVSDDGRLLLTEVGASVIIFWEIATRQAVERITPESGNENFWLSPDHRTLAITRDIGEERGVDIWQVATGEMTDIRLGGHESTITAVAFSADGSKIATASFDGSVRLWDAATGALLHSPFTEHNGRVLAVAFSPDGQILATGGADRKIMLYDVRNNTQIGDPLIGHDNWVRDLRFDAAGDALYSSATDGSLLRWDLTRRQPFVGHTDRARSLALSPDGRILATGGFDRRIFLWDANTGEQLAELPSPHERSIIQVAYSPNGRFLAVGDAGGMVSLWDVEKRQLLHPLLSYHEAVVIGLAFSPDSRVLAAGDFEGDLVLWDVATGALLSAVADAHDGWTLSLAFAPDGQTLASGGTDGRIQLWDVSTLAPGGGESLRTRRAAIPAHDYWVTSLLYTADGETLISGSADRTVRFWNTATGAETGEPLTGNTAQVWGVQFYPPDGERTLLTLDNVGTVRRWDSAARTPLGPALHTGLETEAFVVSPEGNHVFLGSFDERVERWWLDPIPWQQRACAIADRALSIEEWEHFFHNTGYAPACAAP